MEEENELKVKLLSLVDRPVPDLSPSELELSHSSDVKMKVECLSDIQKFPVSFINASNLENASFDGGGGENVIKSVAVVKKSQVEFPVSFRKLQSNTDLKRPPANWFRSQFINPSFQYKHSEFASFIMAYQFPDCIGEVDIVCDAENIKKLVKIPYNPSSHMSMMVHRIGRTILIDEFDISQYILRQTQYQWKWLRKFFYEYVLESMPRKEMDILVRPNKSRDVVQSRNLLSKFLHYSIEESNDFSQSKVDGESPVSVQTISSPIEEMQPELPIEEHVPISTSEPFTRNIVWNFEDLRMLIGTDLPIFGGVTHPCVSLRLKDMNKPINVLTGIDYWLDNLMCNVPEVIMCYHIDGIVKKYEFIKTEDLPRMPNSQFCPQLVRDISHNILSFLKSKATKEGHTYWLFKEKDDIVKLYDLTSLCNERILNMTDCDKDDQNYNENEDNPFTIPVAMLFYCVAKNMWSCPESSSSNFPTIRSLLENALQLLTQEKHSKVICHCHYILADIYIPQNVDPDSAQIVDESEEEVVDDEDEYEEGDSDKEEGMMKDREVPRIKVSSLCQPFVAKKIKQKISKSPKLPSDANERCDLSLHHVLESLHCIMDNVKDGQPSSSASFISVDQDGLPPNCPLPDNEPKMAKPYEPIPLSYSPIMKSSSHDPQTPSEEGLSSNSATNSAPDTGSTSHKSAVATTKAKIVSGTSTYNLSVKEKASIMSNMLLTDSVLNSYFKNASWNDKMKFRLLRKAALIFMMKAKLQFDNENYGSCLRNAKLSLHSWACMGSFFGSKMEFPFPSQPLLIAGDTYYYLSRNWTSTPTYIEQFNSKTNDQTTLENIFDSIISGQDCNWIIKIPCDAIESLRFGYLCYESALPIVKPAPDLVNLKRKLASVCNELACALMNQAHHICQDGGQGLEEGGTLWDDSRFYLKKGLTLFEEVDDKVNMALLHSNYARLLRLSAFHSCGGIEGQVFSSFVRNMQEEAFKEYEMALDILKLKKLASIHLRDSVLWDYGTALFNYATLLQDDPCGDQLEEETRTKQIVALYNRALKLCDTKTQGKNLPLYQYRAAILQIRLADIHHQLYRSNGDKKERHIAELNYSHCCSLFLQLENTTDSLKSHLDYIVLLEDVIKLTTGSKSHWKLYFQILKLLLDCEPVLSSLGEPKEGRGCNRKGKKEVGGEEDEDEGVVRSLLELYEKKLHATLHAMMKLAKSADKSLHCHEEEVKMMYSLSLNKEKLPLLTHLRQAMNKITLQCQSLISKYS